MCNLYSVVRSVEAFRAFVKAFEIADRLGNFAPYPGVFPDYAAPIIRNAPEGRQLTTSRWGMPTPPKFLEGKKVDKGSPISATSPVRIGGAGSASSTAVSADDIVLGK